MALLTDRVLISGVSGNNLIHVVDTSDTSQNPAGSSYKAEISQVGDYFSTLFFPITGNTSGGCISDLYVSNIHSCSPLFINPSDEGKVYFGSSSGVTIDVSNSRLGINTNNPSYTFEMFSTNGQSKLYFPDTGTSVQNLYFSGISSLMPQIGVISYIPTASLTTGIQFGVIGQNNSLYPSYGGPLDCFIYAASNANRLNIISSPTSSPSLSSNTDDIRFYAGQQVDDGFGPDIHIQGKTVSGYTRGHVGIGTSTPSSLLHVNGKTRTTNLQITSGASTNYILKCSDNSGNTEWVSSSTIVPSSKTYGFFYDTTSQTGQTTGNNINELQFNSTGYSSGITVSNSTGITVTSTGYYNVNVSGTLTYTGSPSSMFSMWLRNNGTDITGTMKSFHLPQDNFRYNQVNLNYFVSLNSGDVLSVIWGIGMGNYGYSFQYFVPFIGSYTGTSNYSASVIITEV